MADAAAVAHAVIAPPIVCALDLWPPVLAFTAKCARGLGLAVCHRRAVAVVTCIATAGAASNCLYYHDLHDGTLTAIVDLTRARKKDDGSGGATGDSNDQCGADSGGDERSLDHGIAPPLLLAGLCVTPCDTIIVVESSTRRLQEVTFDGVRWLRYVGGDALAAPRAVDSDGAVIVVGDTASVAVFEYASGGLVRRFGTFGTGIGQLKSTFGIHLLAACGRGDGDSHAHRVRGSTITASVLDVVDTGRGAVGGAGASDVRSDEHNDRAVRVTACAATGTAALVAVADADNHRVCLFSLDGACVDVLAEPTVAVYSPYGVSVCGCGGVLVANFTGHAIAHACTAPRQPFAPPGTPAVPAPGRLYFPCAMVTLPGGGLVVREDSRLRVFKSLVLRLAWLDAVARHCC